MELFDKYGQQYKLLKDLLGSRISQYPTERLNEIFTVTERKWKDNLDRFKDRQVRYLFIAEAPPWTPAEK